MICSVLAGVMVSGSVAISDPNYCEIRSNYIDSVVKHIKDGKTPMHSSMLEISKSWPQNIANRLYSVVDIIDYSEGIKYDWRLENLACEIKKECI